MKYLFIVPNYHIKADSTAIVAKEYIRYLVNHNEDVTVLSFDNFNYPNDILAKEDKLKVISLLDERSRLSKGKSYFQLSAFKKLCIKLSCRIKTIGKIKTNEWPLDAMNEKKIFKYLDNDYDIIISASSPFYSHVLGSELKKKSYTKKWYAMLWDPYVYNVTMPNKLSKRKIAAEKAFRNVDKVYCSDGIINGNILNNYRPEYLSKCVTIKYPGLKEFPKVNKATNKEKTILFYGSFYEDIRNPKEMFNILKNLPNEYKVHLYSKGCEELTSSLDDKYKLFPQVEKDKVPELIMNSNIVINLGNTVINQIPSKIFELISSGKPIINFYFSKDDPSLKYFAKRPMCYSFNLSDYSELDVDKLMEFIKENDSKTLSFEQSIKDLKEFEHQEALSSFFAEITK